MFRILALLLMIVPAACHTAPSSLPGHLEPHHRVLLQNGYVRVMETQIAPGEETFDHSHAIESAYIVLTDGMLRITKDDGSSHDVIMERGTVGFGDSAIVHRVANIGTTTVRVVAVEVFSRPPSRDATATLAGSGALILDNEKVVVSRVQLARDETLALWTAGPSVIIGAGRGRLASEDGTFTFDLGRALWREGDQPALRNAGDDAFEAYIVTLKPRM